MKKGLISDILTTGLNLTSNILGILRVYADLGHIDTHGHWTHYYRFALRHKMQLVCNAYLLI